MYGPPVPPPEHDDRKDVALAAEENPTRRDVARALEHIQAPPRLARCRGSGLSRIKLGEICVFRRGRAGLVCIRRAGCDPLHIRCCAFIPPGQTPGPRSRSPAGG